MSAPEQVLVVDDALRGIALADYLERELPDVRRSSLRALIGGGEVRVNGEVKPSGCRLRAGDVVQITGQTVARPRRGAEREVTVQFESETALVVAKPAGMPTVPDRSGKNAGVHGRLEELRPGADLRIVHRLDRDTSGCLLLAKGLDAARHFDATFQAGGMRKRYVALVEGAVMPAEFAIDAWLGPDPRRPGKVVAGAKRRRGYREAHTGVAVRTAYARFSLLDLVPTTGRGHQLRVHLASIGHPIVGDADYGGQPLLLSQFKRGYKARKGFAERPLVDRFFLHAEELAFADVDGTDVAVTTSMPEDLASALVKLERFAKPR